MPVTAWRRPALVSLVGDGVTSPWNNDDGGVSGDELSDSPAGTNEIYWFTNNDATQFSSTAYASNFGFSADGIGANDRIDGIEIEVSTLPSNKNRPIGLRVLALTLSGQIEDGKNVATRALAAGETITTTTYGSATDLLGADVDRAALEAATFGVLFRTEASGTSGRDARIVSLRMRAHYTVDGLLVQLVLTGLQPGSDVVLTDDAIVPDGADNNVIARFSDIAGTSVSYTYSNPPASVTAAVYRPGFKPTFVRGLSLGPSGLSIPVTQQPDPAYEA